jgi:HAD superfamily hydrolase (TIGR01509 family)
VSRPRPAPVRAVLYDWDGTLLDSAETSFRCYARLFAAYGIRFDRAAFQRTYAPDWYLTYEAIGLPREHWEDADAAWLVHYATEVPRLLPGARETLDALHARGVPQALVTSGNRERVERDLATLDLTEFFQTLVCKEEVAMRKPHPEGLLTALSRLACTPEDAVYVGDSPEDIAMARAAGVYAVAIPGGFPNREALAAAGADTTLESISLLPSHLLSPVDGAARQD